MPKVSSVDYVNKRIYLSSETVALDSLDTLDVYKEVRGLRRTNTDHRKFNRMIVAGELFEKTTGNFTQSYVRLLNGCRIVPFDTSHDIKLIRETFTDDNFSGRDCFDRSSLSPTTAVDIDVDIKEVEIRLIPTGSADLTPVLDAISTVDGKADQINIRTERINQKNP